MAPQSVTVTLQGPFTLNGDWEVRRWAYNDDGEDGEFMLLKRVGQNEESEQDEAQQQNGEKDEDELARDGAGDADNLYMSGGLGDRDESDGDERDECFDGRGDPSLSIHGGGAAAQQGAQNSDNSSDHSDTQVAPIDEDAGHDNDRSRDELVKYEPQDATVTMGNTNNDTATTGRLGRKSSAKGSFTWQRVGADNTINIKNPEILDHEGSSKATRSKFRHNSSVVSSATSATPAKAGGKSKKVPEAIKGPEHSKRQGSRVVLPASTLPPVTETEEDERESPLKPDAGASFPQKSEKRRELGSTRKKDDNDEDVDGMTALVESPGKKRKKEAKPKAQARASKKGRRGK